MRAAGLLMSAAIAALAACSPGGLGRSDGVYAPGIAGASREDGLVVGHRLMAAGEYDLALRAYTRAAGQQGLNVDTLTALGSANLRLGRLGQAETLLRRAIKEEEPFPATWNNLGVLLIERGNYGEASEMFRRAYATDNGNSDQIRNNLRLALARLEEEAYTRTDEGQQAQTMREGFGGFEMVEPL
jgi:Flp pilus assembly protein TadD